VFRTRRVLHSILFFAAALCSAGAYAQSRVHFDLPAQPLAQSLEAIGRATHIDIGFDSSRVAGLTAPAVSADLTVDDALARVLIGTGLRPKRLNDHTIVIVAEAETSEVGPAESKEEATDQLTEVVVTGSHIRGETPAGSQLKVYTREDLDQSGAATLDEFARIIPQNFSNTDGLSGFASNAYLASFSSATANISNGAAFNIHGLGPSATLTLVDGHRIAPSGSTGSFTDISQIPLSAIDHVEILSDGASAIYGTDAVAGVVNIITKKDYDGAETNVRYGDSTQGGAGEVTASQLVGKSWGSGNGLLTYEYDDQVGLDASQRSYIPSQGGPYSLLPESRRNSVLVTGNQAAGADTTVSVEGIYSDRTSSYANTVASSISTSVSAYRSEERQSGLTLSADHALTHDWHISLSVDYSRLQQFWSQAENTSSSGASPLTYVESLDATTQLVEGGLLANGSLFPLPGGLVKSALGADFRREQFGEGAAGAGTVSTPNEHRNVSSAFGEIAVPLIGEANRLPGARRVDFSAAVRYDDYSDFGSTTNFKLGMNWEPLAGLSLKGTFGTSYQAPLLSQLYAPVLSYTFDFPDAASSSGVTDTLYRLGGNPDLGPEKSRAYTAGFDLKPDAIPALELSANYFNIDFRDRLQTPPVTSINALFTSLLAPFIERNPPLSVVEAAFDSPTFVGDLAGQGPQGVKAIFNAVTANIASTRESGLDLTAAYRLRTDYGQVGFAMDVTHLIRNDFQVVSGGPVDALLNAFGQPPKWKGRGGLTWTEGPFTAAAFVNYVNGYQDSLFASAPPISEWVTGDLYFAFKTRDLWPSFVLRNLTAALTVSNVTDKRPPYVGIPVSDLAPGQNPLPFDAANASPVGRLVTLQVTKAWGKL
jgi:iron complex outermembrane recepter protein